MPVGCLKNILRWMISNVLQVRKGIDGSNRQRIDSRWIRWGDDRLKRRRRTGLDVVALSQTDRRSFVVLNAAEGHNGGVDIHRLMPEKLPD